MTLDELLILNEELPRANSKARRVHDEGSDAGDLTRRYDKRIKFLRENPEVFADEMMELFPTFPKTMEKQRESVRETYVDFSKEFANFYKYLSDNKKYNIKAEAKKYRWNKINDQKIINQAINLVEKLNKTKKS